MTKSGGGAEKQGLIKRTWIFITRPHTHYSLGLIAGVGIVVGILFWGGFNWAMEATNTESFCISCHEMKDNVYAEYKRSVHYSNGTGVRATCPDCHVPREWVYKVIRKVRATNELFHHFAGSIDTREKFEAKRLKLATHVWETMKATDSRECRNCHEFESMDFTVQVPRAETRHAQAREEGKTCIDCHKGVVHELPEGTFEAEQRLSQN